MGCERLPVCCVRRRIPFTSTRDRVHSNVSHRKGKTHRRRRNEMAVCTHSHKRSKEHVSSGQQLLPGIPNEVTLDLIVPKLPWRASNVLSSVSRCWQRAIQTNKVYEARVRAKSTETLIVHTHFCDEKDEALALYSTREKCCYQLPLNALLPRGALRLCTFIALDGKVYGLGGSLGERVLSARGEVCVIDLAGQSRWKQCASMLEPRFDFGCGVMDGKLYVFGGTTNAGITNEQNIWKDIIRRSEMYDPHENAWSPIMPIPTTPDGSDHCVATVGKELLLYLGDISTLPVYNPTKNEWRLVEHICEEQLRWPVFIKNDKFYGFYESGIDVYDANQRSWINWKTNSFATVQPDDFAMALPVEVCAVKDELLLTAVIRPSPEGGFICGTFECTGFDSEGKEMVWQRMSCSISSLTDSLVYLKCPIQL